MLPLNYNDSAKECKDAPLGRLCWNPDHAKIV